MVEIASNGLHRSPIHQILVEKCITGWKEVEFEIKTLPKEISLTGEFYQTFKERVHTNFTQSVPKIEGKESSPKPIL